VRRVACSEMYSRRPQQPRLAEQIAKLEDMIAMAQNQGYTPFIIADESLQGCALKCLTAANLTNHSTQSVSIRMAAIAKRRKRDFNGMFYGAIASSLQTGTLFTLVFEDDDEGCGLLAKEDDRWFDRQPSTTPPTNPLPEQWKLSHFYRQGTFPLEVLQPMVFNGRLMSKLFLPEQLREDAMGTVQPSDLAAPAAGSPDRQVTEGGEPPNETEETTRPPSAKGMSKADAAQAAAAPTPAGGVGLTRHVFELPDVTDPRTVGLRTVHHIRPTIVSLSCLPSGLSDDEVCGQVVGRFRSHVPMHRTYLILLTHDSTAEPDQY